MTFYRVHDTDEFEFSADGAWSSQAGITRISADRYECLACEGSCADPNERDDEGNEIPCRDCHGEGSVQCDRGYSCCAAPGDLIAYFSGHMAVGPATPVIVFEGYQTGTCSDGEPLAVPEHVIEQTTWAEFTRRHQAHDPRRKTDQAPHHG
jgi:hypothetical protein